MLDIPSDYLLYLHTICNTDVTLSSQFNVQFARMSKLTTENGKTNATLSIDDVDFLDRINKHNREDF